MAGFETRYAEAQRQASRGTSRRTTNTTNEFAIRNAGQKDLVRKRITEGYELPFGKNVGGRYREPFREEGLRSEENIVLKYFVSLVPRRGRARASWDKATLDVQCREKVLTLDYPYIELNKEFVAALRVDCDGVFPSPEACIFDLLEHVRDGSIPCLPHIVVGDRLDDGRFIRPHFIWLLPYGAAIWNSKDERCRKEPVRLFDAVCRGLTAALLDIGADPAAPTMTMRMKCPTSPIWHTITPNADVWPTLSEYADYVDTGVSRPVLARRAAAIQSGLGLTASNAIFDILRTEGQRLLAEWHFAADSRMRGTREALADHLHQALALFAEKTGLSETKVGYVTGKVADYLAAHFDPTKLDNPRVNRGRLLDVVDGMTSVAARQAAGGRHAAKSNADRTLSKLAEAYRSLSATGGDVTKSALAEAAKVSRRTVINRWNDLISAIEQGCEKQCIDKKAPAGPCAPSNKLTSDTVASYSALFGNSDEDTEALASHEVWIALQEGRVPRLEILNAVSASVGPAPVVPGRYAGAPAADVDSEPTCANYRVIPDSGERYACRSDALIFTTDAVPAFGWPMGPF
jgi:hypothetical protein